MKCNGSLLGMTVTRQTKKTHNANCTWLTTYQVSVTHDTGDVNAECKNRESKKKLQKLLERTEKKYKAQENLRTNGTASVATKHQNGLQRTRYL
jgi:putative alpha-1,2-mannosidase